VTRDDEKSWPPDLAMFGMLSTLWAIVLLARVLFILYSHSAPFEDALLGVKFYGSSARLTMALQAVIIATFGLAIQIRKRWGLVLALIYMLQVLAGHIVFITRNFGAETRRVHVRVAAIEFPGLLLIALYLWFCWIRQRHIAKPQPTVKDETTSSRAHPPPPATTEPASRASTGSIGQPLPLMPRYKVMIADNFHYHDLDDYDEGGTYDTLDKAITVCRYIVDRSLQHEYEQLMTGQTPNLSAEALYDRYTSFGDDPFIKVIDGVDDNAKFSGWTYARQRCHDICQRKSTAS
jgi:hypothetical protein